MGKRIEQYYRKAGLTNAHLIVEYGVEGVGIVEIGKKQSADLVYRYFNTEYGGGG